MAIVLETQSTRDWKNSKLNSFNTVISKEKQEMINAGCVHYTVVVNYFNQGNRVFQHVLFSELVTILNDLNEDGQFDSIEIETYGI